MVSPSIILVTSPLKFELACAKVLLTDMNTMIKKLSTLIFSLFLIFSIQNNGNTKEVQYHFDKRYDYYSDSERMASRVNQRIFYRHSELMQQAIISYEDSVQSYQKCDENIASDFILKFEPNFFYNPLMQTMYADLKYYVFIELGELIRSSSISLKKQMYLQALPRKQLENLYIQFLQEIDKELQDIQTNIKIQGSFCKVL